MMLVCVTDVEGLMIYVKLSPLFDPYDIRQRHPMQSDTLFEKYYTAPELLNSRTRLSGRSLVYTGP